jgi:phasin protein
MAHTARTEAGKATDNVAELGKRTADKGADVAREAIDRTENTARRGFEVAQRTAGAALGVERAVARRSAEGASEVGQAFAELVKEQARNNVEAFRALSRAVDREQVSRVQSELLRASFERAAEFTRRYLEVVQAVVASAVSTTKEQARKAA